MNAMRSLLVGLLLAVTVSVFAAQSGGFPSRPTFQAVNVVGNLTAHGSASIGPASAVLNVAQSAGTVQIYTWNGAGETPVYLQGTDAALLDNNGSTKLGVTPGAVYCNNCAVVPWQSTGSGSLIYAAGCTTGSVSPTITYAIGGKLASVTIGAASCTSTAASISMTGLPAAIQPASTHGVTGVCEVNTSSVGCVLSVNSGGTVSIAPINGVFSGTSGFFGNFAFTYPLNWGHVNGNRQIFWILGALALAGGAYWIYAHASAGTPGGAAGEGGTAGNASGSGSGPSDSLPDGPTAQVLSALQTIGESLGIVSPKGIRNNNPGNLRYVASIPWRGQTGSDGTGYAVFDTAEDGIRALGHQLMTYLGRGINTVSSIISTWAPMNENDTQAYIADVANRLGADPDQPLDGGAIPALAQAIIIHENGSDPYGIAAIATWSTEA